MLAKNRQYPRVLALGTRGPLRKWGERGLGLGLESESEDWNKLGDRHIEGTGVSAVKIRVRVQYCCHSEEPATLVRPFRNQNGRNLFFATPEGGLSPPRDHLVALAASPLFPHGTIDESLSLAVLRPSSAFHSRFKIQRGASSVSLNFAPAERLHSGFIRIQCI